MTRRNRANSAEGAAQQGNPDAPPIMPAADPAIAEEVRRFMEGQQQRIEEDDQRNPVLPSPKANPAGAATILMDRFFTKDGLKQLAYYRETWYSYYKKLWSARTGEDVDHFLRSRLLLCRQVDAEGEIQDFITSRANVSEVMYQIQGDVTIPSHFRAPCTFVDGVWKEVDARGKMVCRGQVIDMRNGKVYSNHNLFIPNGAEWEYMPQAAPSKHLEAFLRSIFGDKDDEIQLLQEWFGYMLSGDTWAQKGMIIVGPKRSGKGTIGHLLSHLLGHSMVASPALHSLGGPFGLENLVDKRMCLISDARLSNRQDIAAVIEMLLRIVACDPVDVNRKHKGALQLMLEARVMMLSNEMPQLGDNSDAINSRFLILSLSESFYGRENYELLNELLTELPAIANWAMQGYIRLRTRGAFAEPESSTAARGEWYEENNPLAQFVEDCCDVSPAQRTEMTTLYDAYKEWSESRGIPFMAANALSRRLSAMLGAKIKRTKSDRTRWVEGIGLGKVAF